MKEREKRIAVIGAGIAGLSAATELQRDGFDVVVFEKETHPGGRMATLSVDDLPFDAGAVFLSNNYSQLKKYSEELGIPWGELLPGGTYRVLRAGKSHPYQLAGILDVLRFSVLSLRSRMRLLFFLARKKISGDFFNLSECPQEDESARDFLLKQVGQEVNDYIADPFLGALHFHRTDEASASALRSLMAMLLTKGAFHPRVPEGGIAAIPRALASRLDVRYGLAPERVARTADGKVSVRVAGRDECFDAAVLACPAPAALAMLANPTLAERDLLSAIRYASTIVLAFRIPADLFPDETHVIYVPFVENTIIASCINEGRKGGAYAQDGSALFTVYLFDSAAKKLLEKSDAEIERAVRKEMAAICPEFADREKEIALAAIFRWPQAMPKFDARAVRAVREFAPQPPIFFAGDWFNSPWTEGAARSGVRAAALARRALRPAGTARDDRIGRP